MNPVEFERAVKHFRATLKKLYLWIGTEERLREFLGSLPIVTLECLELIPDGKPAARNDETAQKALQAKLGKELKALAERTNGRSVLIVRDAVILARYRVSLVPFFDSGYVADERMAVLVLPRLARPERLPGYVRAEPGAALEYLRASVGHQMCVEDSRDA